MGTVKRIVCLANSRKLSGRCIAGIELKNGKPVKWIRPVSEREHEEVSEKERNYEDGSDPKILDIIDVPLLEHRPKSYQQENWLLDPSFYWVKIKRATWDDLLEFPRANESLWTNGDSTYNGQNDRVSLADAAALSSSLRLIRVTEMTLSVLRPGWAFGNPKRRVQGSFRYLGTYYSLWVTDPVYEQKYLAKADGSYEIGESLLTISLGEPFNNYCHKLIAAIIRRKAVEP